MQNKYIKRTKIVCTLGPTSEKKSILEKMVQTGMDVARINFSHGDIIQHKSLIKNIRDISKKLDRPIAIIGDLQGPRIRVGDLGEGITLQKGKSVVLTTEVAVGPRGVIAKDKIPVTYDRMHEDVDRKDIVLIDDGLIQLEVTEVRGRDIFCKVLVGGKLLSHKGINVPTTTLNIPAITQKDREDLEFSIAQGVDYIALSFVKTAEDIRRLRRLINMHERKKGFCPPDYKPCPDENPNVSCTKIIAKIEKHEAVENFDEILKESDAIMVARGDLGIETPIEKVPLIQKIIISKSLSAAKPVITATQMLNSMIENPRPTRAEVSDVANAVIDHTDAVMLSAESATGNYPVEAVRTMAEIIRKTEISPYDDLALKEGARQLLSIDTAIGRAATRLARNVGCKAILVATISGYTARAISRHRPELPIVVTARSGQVQRQLALSWGVIPFILPSCKTVDELINKIIKCVKDKRIVLPKDKVVIVAGQPVGESGNANLIKIHQI